MIGLGAAIACVGLFVLVMAPWWLRQLAVFGSLSPSTASGKVLFIRDIGEWNSITTPATLDHLLGMGLGPLLMTPDRRPRRGLMIYSSLVAGFVLAPFMVIGGWARRRSVDFGPFFAIRGPPVRVLGDRLARSTCPAARSSTPPSRSPRTATSSRSRASRSPSAGRGAVDRPGTRAAATRVFTGGVVGFAVVCRGLRIGVVHARWAAAARPVPRGRARRSTRPAPRRRTG